MKRLMLLALVLAMCACVLTACRSKTANNDTTAPTATMPDSGNMLPGPEDKVDPTSGANETPSETTAAVETVPAESEPGEDMSRIRPHGRVLPKN